MQRFLPIRLFMPLMLLCLGAMPVLAQPAKGLNLVGSRTWPTSLNDVWGYVGANGQEYALVGTGVGPSIVDLSDPSNPTELFWFQRPYSLWWDIKTYGDFAYASNETGGGIMIIDMSGLPDTAIVKDTIIGNIQTIHNLWIDDDGFLYACGGNFTGGLMIMDLKNDPWNPVLTGFYNEAYVHDVYVYNDTAYAAELQNGLTLIDLGNRTNPVSFNNRNYPNSLTHNTWLSPDGKTCFTTDEIFGGNTISWDVSNRNSVQELDRYRSERDGTSIPHNAHVDGKFVVISHYREGVVVVDATHPEYMVEVAYFDSSPLAGQGFDGCWGAYPYLPSGLILSTDVLEGLDVLQPTYKGAAFVRGVVIDGATNQPLGGVGVNMVGVDSLATDINGRFLLGVADSGSYDFNFSRPGYLPLTETLEMDHDSTRRDTFFLFPLPSGQVTFTLVSAEDSSALPDGSILTTVIAEGDTLQYSSLTDLQGTWDATSVVTGQHHVIAGKWGFQTIDTVVEVSDTPQNMVLALEPGYVDEFVLDLGWQVSGDALFGHWVRTHPVGTNLSLGTGFPANPNEDVMGDLGDQAYVTGNATGMQSAETEDLDGGVTILTSPVMDLTSYDSPSINLYWWLTNSNDPDMTAQEKGEGSLTVELLINGVPVGLLTSDTMMSGAWLQFQSPPLPQVTNAQLRITATAGLEEDITEAGIDWVRVQEYVEDTTTVNLPALPFETSRIWVATQTDEEVEFGYQLPAEAQAADAWNLRIVNLQGQVLSEAALDPAQDRINMAFGQQATGLYLLVLRQGEHLIRVEKFQR